MSSVENTLNTSNQQTTRYNVNIIFLRDNKYKTMPYNNSSYDDVTLTAGTVMGRIGSSDYVVPCNAGSSDGSEYPVGILAEDVTAEASADTDIPICVSGEVAQEYINFDDPDDTLNTIVSSDGVNRRYKDLIDQIGVILVLGTDQTGYDNE